VTRIASPRGYSPEGTAIGSKVFCIGFQKTGTTSLGAALQRLGYSVTGGKGAYDPQIAVTAVEWVEQFLPRSDAFRDNPWCILYEYLDRRCPGSKFILTVRDPDSWIRSVVTSFEDKHPTPMREWIYGYATPNGNEAAYLARYNRHNRDVRRYFEGRESDLLVMDLARGDGWERLCGFLGRATVTDEPFPRRNTVEGKKKPMFKARRLLRKVRRRFTS
jgi:hypothetical protein